MKELALHILDIINNSISANASTIKLTINEEMEKDQYTIIIDDNGKGIPADVLRNVTDPYTTSRTTRHVGLGLPLFKQNAERSGGYLNIESTQGTGTTVKVSFGFSNIDRPAIGDIEGTMILLITSHPPIRFIYHHSTPHGHYIFDTQEINSTLDGISINEPAVRKFLLEMLQENLTAIKITR